MKKAVLNVSAIPDPVGAPLSLGIQHGNLVSICGMAPVGPDKTLVGVGDIGAQTAQVLHNISLVLAEAGATLADVIKTTVFLSDISHYDAMNQVYAQHFPKDAYPTRSTLGVKLGHPDLLIEIEAWAVVPARAGQV
jgi:2-iminobutanoate/2-iminopropanoate deaminase